MYIVFIYCRLKSAFRKLIATRIYDEIVAERHKNCDSAFGAVTQNNYGAKSGHFAFHVRLVESERKLSKSRKAAGRNICQRFWKSVFILLRLKFFYLFLDPKFYFLINVI